MQNAVVPANHQPDDPGRNQCNQSGTQNHPGIAFLLPWLAAGK